MTAQRSPASVLPEFRQHLQRLLAIDEMVFSQPLRFDASNHLAFMAASFTVKQAEHGRSVLRLGDSIDAVLITRSMFEGLSQLLWAAQDSADRPLRWRMFAVVRDWRTLQKALNSGAVVPPEVRTEVESRVQREGQIFLTTKALSAMQAGQPLPADPYKLNWYDEREKAVFAAVGAEQVYSDLYGPFSEWHHWRIGGFGRLLRFDSDENSFNVTMHTPDMTATALAGAFQCLYQTLDFLERVVPTGVQLELKAVYDDYVKLA